MSLGIKVEFFTELDGVVAKCTSSGTEATLYNSCTYECSNDTELVGPSTRTVGNP